MRRTATFFTRLMTITNDAKDRTDALKKQYDEIRQDRRLSAEGIKQERQRLEADRLAVERGKKIALDELREEFGREIKSIYSPLNWRPSKQVSDILTSPLADTLTASDYEELLSAFPEIADQKMIVSTANKHGFDVSGIMTADTETAEFDRFLDLASKVQSSAIGATDYDGNFRNFTAMDLINNRALAEVENKPAEIVVTKRGESMVTDIANYIERDLKQSETEMQPTDNEVRQAFLDEFGTAKRDTETARSADLFADEIRHTADLAGECVQMMREKSEQKTKEHAAAEQAEERIKRDQLRAELSGDDEP